MGATRGFTLGSGDQAWKDRLVFPANAACGMTSTSGKSGPDYRSGNLAWWPVSQILLPCLRPSHRGAGSVKREVSQQVAFKSRCRLVARGGLANLPTSLQHISQPATSPDTEDAWRRLARDVHLA